MSFQNPFVLIDPPSRKSLTIALEKPTSILNFVIAVTTGSSYMTQKASSLGRMRSLTP
jgi:hypothetical protein